MSEASEKLTGSTWDVERLLVDALRPIEPPERLSGRFEDTLSAVTQAAAEELSDWAEELSESEVRALREPRDWVLPVVAVDTRRIATCGRPPTAASARRERPLGRRARRPCRSRSRSGARRSRPSGARALR